MKPRARLVAVVLAGLVPWIVLLGQGRGETVSLVFSFGLVNPSSLHVTPIWTYLFVLTDGLPRSLLAWPVAGLLYTVGLASALVGVAGGREDERLTAGLLVFAGASLLPVTAAVGRPGGVTAVPTGAVSLWLVAAWGYGRALRDVVTGAGTRER